LRTLKRPQAALLGTPAASSAAPPAALLSPPDKGQHTSAPPAHTSIITGERGGAQAKSKGCAPIGTHPHIIPPVRSPYFITHTYVACLAPSRLPN
jgi:hypothetical protein